MRDVPDRQGPLSAAGEVELHDEARRVLAALADLPPKQRQVMAWTIDGFSPAEIARNHPAMERNTAMRTNTRSKITVVAGILGLAALLGSAAATAAGGVLADMPSPAHVAAMAPQGMPNPGMPQDARPNIMPEP